MSGMKRELFTNIYIFFIFCRPDLFHDLGTNFQTSSVLSSAKLASAVGGLFPACASVRSLCVEADAAV